MRGLVLGHISLTLWAEVLRVTIGIKRHIIEKCLTVKLDRSSRRNSFNNNKNKGRFVNETLVSYHYPIYIVALVLSSTTFY